MGIVVGRAAHARKFEVWTASIVFRTHRKVAPILAKKEKGGANTHLGPPEVRGDGFPILRSSVRSTLADLAHRGETSSFISVIRFCSNIRRQKQ